jgi:single-stranded DNA-specific DHH superfamily exonuclease
MLSGETIEEIREIIERSQNPLFFFDNDLDGLMSFILFLRHLKRGKGVAAKSYPDLSIAYARKIDEFKPDLIVIVDKPLVSEEFFNYTKMHNIPVIWIDHHPLSQKMVEGISYYNPLYGKNPSNEPVSYWCWKILGEKKDELWIAALGAISDWFIPDFYEEFSSKYSDLIGGKKLPSEILYETRFGLLTKILNFGLKDRTTNVLKMIKALQSAKTPYEVFDDKKFETTRKRYDQINRKYEKFIEKAKEIATGKLLFFQYGGDLSLSGEISNELQHLFPEKIIVVAYIKGEKANISLRSQKIDIREIASKAMKDIIGTSGGHAHASGASMRVEDLPKFKENIEKQLD